MAIWPLNRNKQSTQKKVPSEVEEYYQSERRDRVGVAWLLAGLTLVITVLIVLGLFFGGRWIYRQITHKDDNTTQTAQTNQPSEQSPATTPESSSNTSNSGQSNGGNASSSPTSNTSGTVNAPTQTNNPSSVSSQPTQTSNNLANTGPGQTVGLFALISVVGYLGFSEYLKRKLD